MKLGILFEANHFKEAGGSRLLGDYTVADIKLAPEIERAFELTKSIWKGGGENEVPIVYLDRGDHGCDRGIVMRQGSVDVVPLYGDASFCRSEVVARISFGAGNYENRTQETPRALDFSQLGRVHIGVRARKQFFPANWRALPVHYNEYGRKEEERRRLTPIVEEANVSLRWINGQYDEWSDPELWIRDQNIKSLGANEFHGERTTYCFAAESRIHFLQDEMRDPVLNRFLKKERRMRQAIPLSPMVKCYPDGPEYNFANLAVERLFKSGIDMGVLPSVGYDNVLRLTGRTLPWPDKDFKKMTPMEGIEFLFGKVMPPLTGFVQRLE